MLLKHSDLLSREHEAHLPKEVNNFHSGPQFRVVFVEECIENPALIVNYKGKVEELNTGRLIGINDLVLSKGSRIELRGNNGKVYRLGENAEFSLELLVTGVGSVFFGEIYTFNYKMNPIVGYQKYRTSCYIGDIVQAVFTENNGLNADTFYALEDKIDIWEYDESGVEFNIVSIDKGQSVTLTYDDNKNMRERYKVSKIEQISSDKYKYICDKYMNPSNWID